MLFNSLQNQISYNTTQLHGIISGLALSDLELKLGLYYLTDYLS